MGSFYMWKVYIYMPAPSACFPGSPPVSAHASATKTAKFLRSLLEFCQNLLWNLFVTYTRQHFSRGFRSFGVEFGLLGCEYALPGEKDLTYR